MKLQDTKLTLPVAKPMVYVDLDGVLVDFAKGVSKIYPEFVEGVSDTNKKMDGKMWKHIAAYQKNGGAFWYDCDPMPDAMELWNYVKQFNPQILSATGNLSFGAGPQKLKWVAEKLGADVKVNLVQKAVEKAQFANQNAILIDDKLKAITPWEAAGGIGVLHTSAANTIQKLKQLGL